jgi:hypothetical protein
LGVLAELVEVDSGGEEAGWLSRDHAPPTQKQVDSGGEEAGWMSGNHTPPAQKPELNESVFFISSDSRTRPGLGWGIDVVNIAANEQSQHRHNNNGNPDVDDDSKMHPPGAGQQHQQQQQLQQRAIRVGSPHRISGASQFQLQGDKRARPHSSDCEPPPKRAHRPLEGGGHPVKRVGTDTLHPPATKRRITGKTGPRSF